MLHNYQRLCEGMFLLLISDYCATYFIHHNLHYICQAYYVKKFSIFFVPLESMAFQNKSPFGETKQFIKALLEVIDHPSNVLCNGAWSLQPSWLQNLQFVDKIIFSLAVVWFFLIQMGHKKPINHIIKLQPCFENNKVICIRPSDLMSNVQASQGMKTFFIAKETLIFPPETV